jgi:transcriptional regulator of acetoin/glycerol metabolism
LRELLDRVGRPTEAPAGTASRPSFDVDLTAPLALGKRRLIERYERTYLEAMLKECQNNITDVARRAGMDRVSIYRMLDRFGLRR